MRGQGEAGVELHGARPLGGALHHAAPVGAAAVVQGLTRAPLCSVSSTERAVDILW